MNLSPGGKQPKMRDGQPKGIKQVLKERNLWPTKEIRLTCEQCSGKCDDVNLERCPYITTIRKFARKSWRYMDAYDKGLEGRTAEWAVSKYKSHRRLPENIENLMEQ
ncbi:unnamed protein product [Rhizophagus irregularis]|nr:unnamed protein product [Rhizophagus irregularis]